MAFWHHDPIYAVHPQLIFSFPFFPILIEIVSLTHILFYLSQPNQLDIYSKLTKIMIYSAVS